VASSDLAAERAVLDRARAALERQDGGAALAATREHERRFPHGLLEQEREAMAVRARVQLGRRDEARNRVDRFRARFPGSVLTPALEGQLAPPVASP
jgi:outer membrane protein assembly factor BamD (BamD/ComL family)